MKYELIKETGNDLKKFITYLQRKLGGDIKILAISEEEVIQSMIALNKIKRKKIENEEVKDQFKNEESGQKWINETC